jgi:drug/metabolite transporter (DMT)-like permease
MAVILALGASLTWGIADFFGPLQGRALGALRALVYVEAAGLVGIALIVAVRAAEPRGAVVLLAIPAAVSGTVGLYSYYRGIAVGAISVVAPIAGISAAIPVIVGVISGERPSIWQGLGMAAALIGVFFASREPSAGGGRRVAAGTGLALLAAVGFGGYFPFMHAAGNVDYWWASLVFRITTTLLVLLPALVRRTPLAVPRQRLLPLALIGLGDMFGNLLYAASSAFGLVSVTAVLASLYPIVTVALARLLLSERVARSQEAGIALTLAGVVLISAG